jgi:hypothetical protein
VLIALDYDGTYTADPALWDGFVAAAQKRGHNVIVVTMRYASEPLKVGDLDVFYTGRKAKRAFIEATGVRPHIWIDDMPDFILHGSA